MLLVADIGYGFQLLFICYFFLRLLCYVCYKPLVRRKLEGYTFDHEHLFRVSMSCLQLYISSARNALIILWKAVTLYKSQVIYSPLTARKVHSFSKSQNNNKEYISRPGTGSSNGNRVSGNIRMYTLLWGSCIIFSHISSGFLCILLTFSRHQLL